MEQVDLPDSLVVHVRPAQFVALIASVVQVLWAVVVLAVFFTIADRNPLCFGRRAFLVWVVSLSRSDTVKFVPVAAVETLRRYFPSVRCVST